MRTTIEKNKENIGRYDPNLDNKIFSPSIKLEKAKAYFQEHGIPDFDRILKEAKEKETK